MGRCQQINLVPQSVDIELYAGDGASLRLVVTATDGTPIPIDGVVTAQIRLTRTDPAIMTAFATDLTDGPEGIILLSLTGLQTADLVNGQDFSGVWDVEWNSGTAEPVTLMQGKVSCVLDVSH
jgi:hypothetical protein